MAVSTMAVKRLVMTTNQRLREIRLEAGISETELAKRIGKSRTTVYKIERGTMDPKHSTLLSWVGACGYTIGIVPAENDLLRQLSELDPECQQLVGALLAILPDLSPEYREVYARIFGALPGHLDTQP